MTNAERKRSARYGVGPEKYDQMVIAQQGLCAICGSACPTGRSLAIDHDHKTGEVRGLLCMDCNTAIGKFGDDPNKLLAAAAYLLQYKDVLRGAN